MRHFIIIPALFLCCSCLYAQQFGIALGVDIPEDSFAEGAMRGGITGGLACKIRATEGFNIRTELLYARRNMIYTTHFIQPWVVGNEPTSAQTDIALHYIDLPLLFSLVGVQNESFELSLDMGVYGAVLVGTSSYTPPEFGFTVEPGRKSAEFGAIFGIGTAFSFGSGWLGLDLRYRSTGVSAVQEFNDRYMIDGAEYVTPIENTQKLGTATLAASFFF